MTHRKLVIAIATGLAVTAAGPILAQDVTVDGYAKSSGGTVWKSSSGECVRTGYEDSTELLEECGYETVVEQAAAIDSGRRGTEVTIVQEAAVVKDDQVIALAAPVVVEQVTINNVQFGFDSADLTPAYRAELDAVSEILRPHRDLLRSGVETLNIVGYTDSQGPAEYNQQLSERRARSVADYLIEQDPTRAEFVSVVGRGEADPIASNDTEDGRRQNRRVVMEVLKR